MSTTSPRLRFVTPELQIGDLDGFTSDTDLFGRKIIADGLTHLLDISSDPIVIAIDAKWGSGKTVFLKQWAGELRKSGFPVIYFDAFKNDYSEDAFAAIAGDIVELFGNVSKENSPRIKTFVDKTLRVAKVLTRSGLRVGVKLATLNTLDTIDIEDAAKAVGDELSELEDIYIGEVITKQKEIKDIFLRFREALEALPALMSDNVEECRPLIFIVDELDRCRPAFALQLLERVKHFFSVKNVHFVLGAHLSQLSCAVSATYGQGIDAHSYLQKFIQLTVNLGETGTAPHERVSVIYIHKLLREFGLGSTGGENMPLLFNEAEIRGLSLRQIERILSHVSLAMAFSGRRFAPMELVSGLCILKTIEPGLYELARRRQLTWKAIEQAFHLGTPTDQSIGSLEYATKLWRFATDPLMSDSEQSEAAGWLNRYRFYNRFDIVPMLIANTIDRIQVTTAH